MSRPFALLAALAFSAAASADEGKRWFAGGAIGLSQADGYEAAALTSDIDDEDIGWRAHIGYRFARHFAVRADYVDFGDLEAFGTVPAPPADFTDRVAVSGLEIAAMGLWPLGRRIELYGSASALRWDQDVTTTLGSQRFRSSAGDWSPGLGGGLNVLWGSTLAVTLDARRYLRVGDIEATAREHRRDLFTAGVTFRFGN